MLKVRPLNSLDISKEKSREISLVFRNNDDAERVDFSGNTVVSEDPYDLDRSEDNLFVEDNLFYKPTHIKLPIPILNVFLAGTNLSAFSKLLNACSNIDVKKLASGEAILDISSGVPQVRYPKSISTSEIYISKDHKIGGDAIRYLLDNFDVDVVIKLYLLKKVNESFGYNVRKDMPNKSMGEIVTDNGDVWLIDNYYVNLYDSEYIDKLKNISANIREIILADDSGKGEFLPLITILLNFRDYPNRFKDQIQKVISVLPLGFRPTIDNQKDPISVSYNRLIQASNDLSNSLIVTGSKLNNVRLKYMSMYKKYMELVYKKNAYDEEKFKPLIQLLTGKEGIIRDKVQASIIDFSGRSVITVDPFMSVDTIGIPESMAISLCEFDAVREFKSNSINKAVALEDKFKEALKKKAIAILDGSYICIGRQPTLHLLGIQGFRVKVVKGNSIVLNPIVTPAFNADFDGDQMHANRPQSKEAQEEVRRLMANVNNIFLPRDGSCHLSPRQEMIYGLYKCYHAESSEISRTITYTDDVEFRDNILNQLEMQEVLIDDKCVIGNKEYRSIGYAALKVFLGKSEIQKIRIGVTPITTDESIPEKCVKETFFKHLFKHIRLNYSTKTFIDLVNRFVRLGFVVANLYAPDINILIDIDTSDLKEEFESSISQREEYYNLGFDTDESFSLFYQTQYNKLEKKVLDRIKIKLGKNNGFTELIESGARGSNSNLLQLFGMKGSILKNQSEAFNTIITTSLSEQLSGLEHFITAYGSRQGIIDKVIGTYAPGYLSRKMSHVCRHLSIVSDDCNTEDGIEITYDFLKKYIGKDKLIGEDSVDLLNIKKFCTELIESRFIVGGGVTPLSKEDAEIVFNTKVASLDNNGSIVKHKGIKLRSPITCKDQCCTKCYGIDLSTHKMAVKGTAIGYLAHMSLGEPVTQLIMKNFQKGGVAGNKNLTSSFDTINDLLEMYPVSKIDSKDEPIYHDYISPVTGEIKTTPRGDGTARLSVLDPKGKDLLREKVYVYESIKLKDFVNRGDSIQLIEGQLDINEILKYRGPDEAQMHMLFSSYNIYRDEVFCNFKHFEVLISGLTLYICSKSNSQFQIGKYYSNKEYLTGNREGAEFIKVVKGLKQVPKIRNNFLTSIYLEDVSNVTSRNIIVSGEDSLEDPLVRVSLGLQPKLGTYYPEYIETRGV